ncbi:sugar transporter [Rhizobium grahamii]|uniref:Sugar transporter n=1 Tax=Rhizobium grahamii TaxID=1120045 RepID=A0A5Q0C7N9_9HYPH|nr:MULTISPECIES: GumC family protein [Rhizobium]QFY61968.1 sugar transporter [Rhizobium grahamii]QRM48856.1 sugar transporter [Rhizobium sp. BG6]
MTQFDRNRASRLPHWRSYETAPPLPERAAPRSPALRPSDFLPKKPAPASIIPDSPAAEPTPEPQAEFIAPVEETPAKIEVPEPAPAYIPGEPLLDLRSAVDAIWRRRLVVLAAAVAGALLGAVVLPMSPEKFTANTKLFFDPRPAGLGDPSAQSSVPSPEMVSGIIDSQMQILLSGNVLRRVADAMNLDADPEFNAGRADGAAVIGTLAKALVIDRPAGSYVVSLTATTKGAEKSAKLANQVVASFLQEETNANNGAYENTSATLDARLNDLRKQVQDAEQAVETYRADNDMAATQNGLISDQRLASLNNLLVTAQDKTIQAKAKADAAANLRFEDVVSDNQQANAASTALASLRQQYSTQAAIVGSLQSQMGSRHPRLQAARSSLQSIADEIRGELQRLASSARAEYEQAKKAEDAISKELTVQKALQVNTSDKQVELNELQRKAAAARDIYEIVQKRSSQTSEERNLSQTNLRVISPAEIPLKANGPGKKILLIAGVIGGLLAGFLAGAGFAIVASLVSHPVIRSYLRPRQRTRPGANA